MHAPRLNSVKLLVVRTVAGKLLKTVEARMMGEFMKTTVFVVGKTKCSGRVLYGLDRVGWLALTLGLCRCVDDLE